MIILDTNVISELMRAAPEPRVVRWVNAQPATNLFLSSITEAEILHGILLLPKGKRREGLLAAADAVFRGEFADRVLPFASDAAAAYAAVSADRRRLGLPISAFDAQIAGIARAFGADLATRNVDDFEGCGIDIIDPWSA
jgi:hypothetical protein